MNNSYGTGVNRSNGRSNNSCLKTNALPSLTKKKQSRTCEAYINLKVCGWLPVEDKKATCCKRVIEEYQQDCVSLKTCKCFIEKRSKPVNVAPGNPLEISLSLKNLDCKVHHWRNQTDFIKVPECDLYCERPLLTQGFFKRSQFLPGTKNSFFATRKTEAKRKRCLLPRYARDNLIVYGHKIGLNQETSSFQFNELLSFGRNREYMGENMLNDAISLTTSDSTTIENHYHLIPPGESVDKSVLSEDGVEKDFFGGHCHDKEVLSEAAIVSERRKDNPSCSSSIKSSKDDIEEQAGPSDDFSSTSTSITLNDHNSLASPDVIHVVKTTKESQFKNSLSNRKDKATSLFTWKKNFEMPMEHERNPQRGGNLAKLKDISSPIKLMNQTRMKNTLHPSARGEIKRMERSIEDLLRRNAFLKREIEREKMEIANLVPETKLSEATEKNRKLNAIQKNTSQEIRRVKERIANEQKLYDKTLLQEAENINQLKGMEMQRKRLKNEIGLNSEKRSSLEKEKVTLITKENLLKKRLSNIGENFQAEERVKIEAKRETQIMLDEVRKVEESVSNEEVMKLQSKDSLKMKEKILSTTTKIYNRLKDKIRDQDSRKHELLESLHQLQRDLEDLKRLSKKSSLKLAEVQQIFRRKEEVKMNMKHIGTQTTGSFVLMRDIAWIRVAEEEVILSPLYGDKSDLLQKLDLIKDGDVYLFLEASRGESTGGSLPVGSVTPLFEVYNMAPTNNNESGSPSRRGTAVQNRRLVDALEGSEYLWLGDNGEL